MTAPDIAAFLRDRIAEVERRVADWDSDGRCQVASMWTGGDPGYSTVACAHPGQPWIAGGREVMEPRDVEVLWDPAHVLAWCAAIRAVAKLHRPVKFTAVHLGIRDSTVCFTCHSRLDEPDDWPESEDWSFPLVQDVYPCRTLRTVASIWSDHPAFDQSWHV